jgi:hypothetical protein
MGPINNYFGVLYLGVAAGVYFRPECAIYGSRIAAIVILITGITISKLLYQLFIYPQFFTPLKHFPAPPVSIKSTVATLDSELTASRIGTGSRAIRVVCSSTLPMR